MVAGSGARLAAKNRGMAANWTAELVRIAGGDYPFADVGGHSKTLEWPALVRA